MESANKDSRPLFFLAVGLILVLEGCATHLPLPDLGRTFDFHRDTFSYKNDLYWQYDFGSDSGGTNVDSDNELVEYGQRCVLMARTARQFYMAALFDPEAPAVSRAKFRDLVQRVLDFDPREEQPPVSPVRIPGYPDLRHFSQEFEMVLKNEMGGRWQSYFQRGNWRLVFPFSPKHQRVTVRELLADLARGYPPIVHIVNFPLHTINHTVLVFSAKESPTMIQFSTYDPTDAENPVELVYDRGASTFHFPRTEYFQGGPVKVYEVYDGLLF